MLLPLNPSVLVGHHIVFTAAAAAVVPAFNTPRIHEITAFCGVVGGEPHYMVAPLFSDGSLDLGAEKDAFLSELRVVGIEGEEARVISRIAHELS
jgi:predicted nucleic acid-binding protein